MQLIGLLGGTFNPIHFGHLRMAQELADALNFDEVRFIPSANPPHKATPAVSAEHRAAMVKLAIADNPLFNCDTRELTRNGASYTIDTLISLRRELGEATSLCLLLGSDAFMQLNRWHRWQELLHYCHIILVQRPNTSANQHELVNDLEQLLQAHYRQDIASLSTRNAGYIHMQATTTQDISSTVIRAQLKQGKNLRYFVPHTVLEYITLTQLYQ
ncbi:MAG: nicotinate-nucleotide adenylyltransferase [Methylophilaceae bacterium]